MSVSGAIHGKENSRLAVLIRNIRVLLTFSLLEVVTFCDSSHDANFKFF